MAVWPHTATRAILDSMEPAVKYTFYARTATLGWEAFEVEPDWALSRVANAAAILRCDPINEELTYSDEDYTANRQALASQLRLDCTIGGVTETLFYGLINLNKPMRAQYEVEAYDPLASWNTTTSEFLLEATRIALGDDLPLVELTGNGYTDVYGIDTSEANAFLDANTSNPRRPWAPSGLRVLDGNGDPLETGKWKPHPEIGAIQLLDAANTTLPLTITGVEVYEEGTLDISDPLKEIITAAKADGGLGGSSANWTITRTVGTGSTTTVIVLQQGCRHLYPLHNITVGGNTRRIASRDLSAGTITLETALPGAPTNGTSLTYDSLNIAVDLTLAEWEHGRGSNMDFYKQTLERVNGAVMLLYNPNHDVYELLRYEQADDAEYDLPLDGQVLMSQQRTLADIYTRQIALGELERPTNLLNATTLISAPELGAPAKWYNDGKVEYDDSGATDHTEYWYDGNFNTSYGWHDGYDYQTYYELGRWDVAQGGAAKRIRRIITFAPSSQHQGADGSYRMFGYTWEGSSDGGSTWFVMSPALEERLIAPSDGVDVQGSDIFQPLVEQMRLMSKPAKDGANNLSDPFLAVAEVGAYERVQYTVIAQIQDTTPGETYRVRVPWAPYYFDVPTYFPALLERLGGVHRTAPVSQLGSQLNEVKALELMYLKLYDSIRLYQGVDYKAVLDPYCRIGDTVNAVDELHGSHVILVEEVEGSRVETNLRGKNYNAEVL